MEVLQAAGCLKAAHHVQRVYSSLLIEIKIAVNVYK